jgi:uncharacterized membrane protein
MLALRHRRLREAIPLATAVAGLLIGGSALSVTLRHAPGAMVGMVLVAFQVGLGSLLRQRTRLGAEQRAAWTGFTGFLSELPNAAEKPNAGEAWERFLVYGLPLGASNQVTRALAADPSLADGAFQWVVAAPNGKSTAEARSAFFSSLAAEFVAPAAAAFVKRKAQGANA